jgi:hypothetical protein
LSYAKAVELKLIFVVGKEGPTAVHVLCLARGAAKNVSWIGQESGNAIDAGFVLRLPKSGTRNWSSVTNAGFLGNCAVI